MFTYYYIEFVLSFYITILCVAIMLSNIFLFYSFITTIAQISLLKKKYNMMILMIWSKCSVKVVWNILLDPISSVLLTVGNEVFSGQSHPTKLTTIGGGLIFWSATRLSLKYLFYDPIERVILSVHQRTYNLKKKTFNIEHKTKTFLLAMFNYFNICIFVKLKFDPGQER